ncbi:MAG TPA: ATP-binding cassette domain-containing protein, partial [Thermoleophilia bacterium]|nr:ATP-binding cassette domain-containing protein [Thermoleophilia bacterium]
SLCKRYGDTVAVKDMSFEVGPGSIFALLGPNGAGKTTVINMLTTLLPIDGGRASIAGVDVREYPDVVRGLVGLAGQSAAVDEKLTARENLDLFGRLYKIPKAGRQARTIELIERFRMSDYADRPVSTYSGGQRRRLDVVASLIADPPALFLDEPTTGLDPRSRVELWQEIRKLAQQGTAVLLTTQYLDEADQLADRIAVIDEGVVVASGTAQLLKDDLERDVLEIRVKTPEDRQTAAAALVTEGIESADDGTGTLLSIPVPDGSASSLSILRRIEDSGALIVDFHYRRPTLDDVFLALTERTTAEAAR